MSDKKLSGGWDARVLGAWAFLFALSGILCRFSVYNTSNIFYALLGGILICIALIIVIFYLFKKEFQNLIPALITFLGIFMVAIFLEVMFTESVSDTFQELLGTRGTSNSNGGPKKLVLDFLSLIIGGVVALYGLIALNKRAEAQDKANHIMEKRHVQDQRQAAVEHLGNDSSSARIASFYEFLDLANDKSDKDYTQNVLNILRAHLLNRGHVKYDNKQLQHGEMQILADVLFSEKAKSVFDKLDYDLQHVKFPPKIYFRKMYKPTGNVDFRNANLSEATFAGNDLSGFNFRFATLRKTNFWLTNLQKADLFDAKLFDATLDGSNLSNADLSWADLHGANLLSVNFSGANLRGAKLKDAKWLNSAILSEAEYNNNTTFPDGFNPEEHGMIKEE